MGSAPASGAADDALVVGIAVRGCGSKQYARHTKVRREGAPNSSRGCCAPPPFSLFAPCSNGLGSAPAPGAADDALVVGIPVRGCRSKEHACHTKVRREGAPNSSRGGCAPRNHSMTHRRKQRKRRGARASRPQVSAPPPKSFRRGPPSVLSVCSCSNCIDTA